jgi:hypothetical protein
MSPWAVNLLNLNKRIFLMNKLLVVVFGALVGIGCGSPNNNSLGQSWNPEVSDSGVGSSGSLNSVDSAVPDAIVADSGVDSGFEGFTKVCISGATSCICSNWNYASLENHLALNPDAVIVNDCSGVCRVAGEVCACDTGVVDSNKGSLVSYYQSRGLVITGSCSSWFNSGEVLPPAECAAGNKTIDVGVNCICQTNGPDKNTWNCNVDGGVDAG